MGWTRGASSWEQWEIHRKAAEGAKGAQRVDLLMENAERQ